MSCGGGIRVVENGVKAKPGRASPRPATPVSRAKSPVTFAGSRGETRVHTSTFAFSHRPQSPFAEGLVAAFDESPLFPVLFRHGHTNRRVRTRIPEARSAFLRRLGGDFATR